jgi:hypothetical protein
MPSHIENKKRRSARGQHTVELVCGLIFLVPFFLFLVDVAFVYMAGETNKQVCRDAARAAAEVIPDFTGAGPGSDPGPRVCGPNDPTFRRAQSVVERLRTRGEQQWIRGVNLDSVIVDLGRVDDAANAALGGPIPGTVTVATTLRARPPALIPGVFDQINLTNQFTFDLTAVRQTTIIPNER